MKKIIILGTLALWSVSLQAQNNKSQDEGLKIREAYLNSAEYKNASIPPKVEVLQTNKETSIANEKSKTNIDGQGTSTTNVKTDLQQKNTASPSNPTRTTEQKVVVDEPKPTLIKNSKSSSGTTSK